LGSKEEKASFLKKRSKKLFRNWADGAETSTAQFKKVFAPLFSKSGHFLKP